MALDLTLVDPKLKTAQDGILHNPIIEILSSQWTNDIPFDGQFLDGISNETDPSVIVHSSGRLCLIYILNGGGGTKYLHYVYTDTNRTEFTHVNFTDYNGMKDVSLCELTNGDIGIIYRYESGGNYYVRYKIISVTGTQLFDGAIFNQANTIYLSGPCVIKLANSTYLMVYGKQSSSNYYIYKRTSTDFKTGWTETQLSIGGLTATKRKGHPSLFQISTGAIFLWFDYLESTGPNGKELTNIYYSIGTSDGVTWANAVKVTNYIDYSAVGNHPISVQKEINTLHLVFNEIQGFLAMNSSTEGWCCGGDYYLSRIHFDSVNRMLYVYIKNRGVLKINVDTWLIDNCWNYTTIPGFHPAIADGKSDWKLKGDGPLMPRSSGNGYIINVLDGEVNSIRNYFLKTGTYEGYPVEQNVFPTVLGDVKYLQADYANQRLWVVTYKPSDVWGNPAHLYYGYIDLTILSAPYTYTQVADLTIDFGGFTTSYYTIDVATDLLLIGEDRYYTGWGNPKFVAIILSTGAIWKNYSYPTYSGFLYWGIKNVVYRDNKAYAAFTYHSGDGQGDRRGLLVMDLAHDTFTYYRPSYATVDEYYFNEIIINDAGKVIIACGMPGVTDGVAIFDPVDYSWVLYNDTNIPGLSQHEMTWIAFDELNQMIFTGPGNYFSGRSVFAFSLYGSLKQSQYLIGHYTTSWAFTLPADPLVQGINDYDASICFDPSDHGMYAFWTNKLLFEESIMWDKESANFKVSDYLVRGEELTIRRTIDGSPSELNFIVSKGHMFDPHNNASLLGIYLEKGRKLVLQIGEIVDSANYWQPQGMFTVSETSLSYEKGTYPVMNVKAEDRLAIWKQSDIIASEYYATFPETVIEYIVLAYTDFLIGNIDLPVFDNRIEIYHQWLDTSIFDMILQICHRFGYYPRIDVDGKLTARKISDSNSVDHIYSDTAKMINFTPDDTFSDFTNKVTITGEERDFIDVMFAEERITSKNGTVGWYSGSESHTIYFSDDKSRRCINARLGDVKISPIIALAIGQTTDISISEVDSNYKYIVVLIEGPSTIGAIVSALVSLVLSYFIPDWVVSAFGGSTIRYGTWLSSLFLFNALTILTNISNYSFTVYAQPLGKIKRSIQAVAEDLEFQNEVGMVVEKKFEDPICYTVEQCQQVANFELMITELQRSRIKFSKIMHLQDEEGDTIQIPHPYTGDSLTIFVTDINRRIKIPEKSNDDAPMIDEIEGWRL